jgi:UPF0716 family protein affecting phage T7 exclusion
MSLFASFNSVLQVVAAFLIFVTGYLGLFLAILICMVTARFIYEGAALIRAHARVKEPHEAKLLYHGPC